MTKFYLIKYKEKKENIANDIYNKDKNTIYKSKTSKIKVSNSNFLLIKKQQYQNGKYENGNNTILFI